MPSRAKIRQRAVVKILFPTCDPVPWNIIYDAITVSPFKSLLINTGTPLYIGTLGLTPRIIAEPVRAIRTVHTYKSTRFTPRTSIIGAFIYSLRYNLFRMLTFRIRRTAVKFTVFAGSFYHNRTASGTPLSFRMSFDNTLPRLLYECTQKFYLIFQKRL